MIKTTPEQNKTLVLQAFDTLFNKRDYKAAERYWSSNYIQHSAHIAPGRDGLFNLVRSTPPLSSTTTPGDPAGSSNQYRLWSSRAWQFHRSSRRAGFEMS